MRVLMRALVPCAGLALTLWGAAAQATTVRVLSQAELTGAAEVIVVGRVETRESAWRGTRIYTRHRVAVEETWRGRPLGSLEVWTLGGVVGDVGQSVPGAARLQVGERVVLYLARGPQPLGGWFPVGMWQGVYHVGADGSLHRDPHGSSEVGPAVPAPPPVDLPTLREQTVDALGPGVP